MQQGKPEQRGRDESTRFAARRILPIAMHHIPAVRRVVDIGCGVGTWLNAADELVGPLLHARGIDCHNQFDQLVIPRESYMRLDLEELAARNEPLFGASACFFDLAICLEVVEHLRPHLATGFLQQICRMSSYVLFSAAIPGQGGIGHVNEQWPDYWRAKFSELEFNMLDVVRKVVWFDAKIPPWYRQNTFLFARRHAHLLTNHAERAHLEIPVRAVHPEVWDMRRRAPW